MNKEKLKQLFEEFLEEKKHELEEIYENDDDEPKKKCEVVINSNGETVELYSEKDFRFSFAEIEYVCSHYNNYPFKILKKCMKHSSTFINYLLEFGNFNETWEYLKLKHNKLIPNNKLYYLCNIDMNNKNKLHSIFYTLIKNNITIDTMNKVFLFEHTPQKYFNNMNDDLFERIELFKSKGISIHPFMWYDYNRLIENSYIDSICRSQEQCTYNYKNVTDDFIRVCHEYSLNVSPKAFTDYKIHEQNPMFLEVKYCGTTCFLQKDKIYCQNLKKILNELVIDDSDEKVKELKNFFNLTLDRKETVFIDSSSNEQTLKIIDKKEEKEKEEKEEKNIKKTSKQRTIHINIPDEGDSFTINGKEFSKKNEPILYKIILDLTIV